MFCGENYQHMPAPTQNCSIPAPDGSIITAPCFNALSAPLCSNNGDVKLPYGSGPYVGMGFLVCSTQYNVVELILHSIHCDNSVANSVQCGRHMQMLKLQS